MLCHKALQWQGQRATQIHKMFIFTSCNAYVHVHAMYMLNKFPGTYAMYKQHVYNDVYVKYTLARQPVCMLNLSSAEAAYYNHKSICVCLLDTDLLDNC